MFLVTQNFQITAAFQDLLLAALVNATPSAILDVTSKLGLYKTGPTPTYGSVVGAFTACDFTGYATVTIATVSTPVNVPNGAGVFKDCSFTASAAVSPAQSALGAYLTDSAGTTLLGAEQFITPVPFNLTGDTLNYNFLLSPRTLWGGQNG